MSTVTLAEIYGQTSSLYHWFFGYLTINAFPYKNPIIMGALCLTLLIAFSVLASITYFGKWKVLVKDWLMSVDHKKIGIMYMILAGVMFFRGFSDAAMMRLQQAWASATVHGVGYLPQDHFAQVFTAHGAIMIFFVAMTFVFGLVNYIVPQQIGARDVAYPYLNSLSFWLTFISAMLIMASLFIGDFAGTGWLAYPPLSERAFSPTVGVDYYLWALSISGIGTLIGGINIFVTIVKMRCKGMTLMKMPLFTWSVLCAMVLIIVSFPMLNITLFLLFLDRFMDMHFFTNSAGGNPMMYINLIWTWGHPEVYILVLPAFGIFSEVFATFCKKPIFGYAAMVYATAVITILAFTVWLHHFFTMGAGANVNAFFGIATMIISIPTGVKVFNWLATMYRGRIHFELPMYWSIAFLTTFAIGGMTGVLMSVPGVDFIVHNSVFLVAHFHNTIIGGVVFGLIAGYTYWFPKMFGFKLNERLGKWAFWFWVPGFYVAFMPLYYLGLNGMTRRLADPPTQFHYPLVVAGIGAAMIFIGTMLLVVQLLVSIKNRKQYAVGGDPWDARTLEWSMPSPSPFYNFAHEPEAHGTHEALWDQKQQGKAETKKSYTDIHMPKNTIIGFAIGIFAGVFGFAMTWHMAIIAIVSGVICIGLAISRFFNFNIDYYVKAAEVEEIENSYGVK